MIEPSLSDLIQARLAMFRVVALVGLRQCGKTTLARSLTKTYFNLEDPLRNRRWTQIDTDQQRSSLAHRLRPLSENLFRPKQI